MYDWATISKSFIRIWAFFLSWILPIHFLHWDVDTNHFWSLSRSYWTRVRVVIESLSAVLDQTIIYPAIRAQSLLRASWESLCWPNYRSRVNPAFSSQYSEEKCIILTFFTAKVFNLNQFFSNSVTLWVNFKANSLTGSVWPSLLLSSASCLFDTGSVIRPVYVTRYSLPSNVLILFAVCNLWCSDHTTLYGYCLT